MTHIIYTTSHGRKITVRTVISKLQITIISTVQVQSKNIEHIAEYTFMEYIYNELSINLTKYFSGIILR